MKLLKYNLNQSNVKKMIGIKISIFFLLFFLLFSNPATSKIDTSSVNQNLNIVLRNNERKDFNLPSVDEILKFSPRKPSNDQFVNYTVTLKLFPETSNISMDVEIDFKNPSLSVLTKIKLYHWLLDFTQENVPEFMLTDTPLYGNEFPIMYPNEFQDIQIDYGEFYVNENLQNISLFTNWIEIDLDVPILVDQLIKIEFTLNSTIPVSSRRYGRAEMPGYNDTFLLSNFIPSIPVFEDGDWKINTRSWYFEPYYSEYGRFNVTVITPHDFVSAGVGKVLDEQLISNSTLRKKQYLATPTMDWGLVGSYSLLEKQNNFTLVSGKQIEITSLYIEDDLTEFSVDFAADALKFYSYIWGDYPYDTFLVGLHSLFSPGLEFPMMTMISPLNHHFEYLERLVGHEVGHQFNMGHIGFNQEKEPFMDEGLQSYSDVLLSLNRGTLTESELSEYNKQDVIRFISLTTRPVNKTVSQLKEIGSNGLPYFGGRMIYNNLANVLGRDVFSEVYTQFTNKYRFAHPKGTDFINIFAELTRQAWIKEYFDYFFNTPAGSPIYQMDAAVQLSNQTHTKIKFSIGSTSTPIVKKILQRIKISFSNDGESKMRDVIMDGNDFTIIVNMGNITTIKMDPLFNSIANYTPRSFTFDNGAGETEISDNINTSSISSATSILDNSMTTTTTENTIVNSNSDDTPFLIKFGFVGIFILIYLRKNELLKSNFSKFIK